MSTPANSLSLREQILKLITDHIIHLEGVPPDSILVFVLYLLQGRKDRFRISSGVGEPAKLTGWGARLDKDDERILLVLGEAEESLMAKGVARALSEDENASWLREHLAPKATLRNEGYVDHKRDDGYFLTEKGRNAYESLTAE